MTSPRLPGYGCPAHRRGHHQRANQNDRFGSSGREVARTRHRFGLRTSAAAAPAPPAA
nr:hypothetical protein [Kibdelosporangium sp. MJ126-NF4]CTQ99431.1 hypothetical protein [Kibdelosporangium sp. MJ126-NF4]